MKKYLIFDSKEEADKVIPANMIRKIQIEGKRYGLAHSKNGFIAFQKECPHAGGDLSRGTLNNFNQVVCPLHAYMFDLKSGEEDQRRCNHIKIYETLWDDNKLFMLIK